MNFGKGYLLGTAAGGLVAACFMFGFGHPKFGVMFLAISMVAQVFYVRLWEPWWWKSDDSNTSDVSDG